MLCGFLEVHRIVFCLTLVVLMARPVEAQTAPKDWHLNLLLLKDRLSVCQLAPGEKVPAWATRGPFTSITRTADEVSVVCEEGVAPKGTKCETDWRILKIQGPLDFALTGILASVSKPLADARVSIFAISTYDTDYVMVKNENVERAVHALTAAGHRVKRQ